MDTLFFEKKLEKRMKDSKICEMACLYLNLSTYKRNKEDSATRNMRRIIITCFEEVSLDDISVEFIEKFLSNPKLKKEEYITAIRFLIFIIENNFMDNEIISRLVLFKPFLVNRDLQKLIRCILYTNRFNDFLDRGFLETSTGVNLFTMGFNKDDFSDDRIYNFLCEFLEDLKLNKDDVSFFTIKSLCREFIKVGEDFLLDIKVEDITLEYINEKLHLPRFSEKYVPIKRLTQILIFINNKTELQDDNIKYLLSFEDLLLSNEFTIHCLKYIARSKNIKQAISNIEIHGIRTILSYANIECEELLNQWLEFYKQKNDNRECFHIVSANFDDSLKMFEINSLDDINFETYYNQLFYFNNKFNIKCAKLITSFYLFLSKHFNPNLFEDSNIDVMVLQRCGICEELLDGFKIINYNPVEDIPKEDKWLLFYRNIDKNNSATTSTGLILVDLTKIKSDEYRFWVKYYIWKNTSSVKGRVDNLYALVDFFNYIYDLKNGIELSIYCKPNTSLNINTNEIIAYKMYILNRRISEKTRRSYLSIVSRCLDNISLHQISSFEKGVFYSLKYKSDNSTNPRTLSNEEISKLVSYTKELSSDSVIDAIYHSIICLLLETEFRISQILSLTIDCIKEANKTNQYVIVSRTKISSEEEQQPISIQTKRTLDNVINLTYQYRKDCAIDNLKTYIFLVPGKKNGTYKIITPDNVRKYMKKCCENIGLPAYNASNLRDTHITKVKDFIAKNKMSALTEKVLTGHLSSNSDNYYEDIDIRTLLEATYGMVIGDVDIKGKIIDKVPENISTDKNLVYHECGYCEAKTCHDNSYLECLMCKDFIATISRIPFFQKQIEFIDNEILKKEIRHDKEDLVNIKRLLLEYLNRLLEMMEGLDSDE